MIRTAVPPKNVVHVTPEALADSLISVIMTSYVEAMITIRQASSGICGVLLFICQVTSYIRTFLWAMLSRRARVASRLLADAAGDRRQMAPHGLPAPLAPEVAGPPGPASDSQRDAGPHPEAQQGEPVVEPGPDQGHARASRL